jgi:hypothetical protein
MRPNTIMVAKNEAGDWRDPAHVRSWVVSVVSELRSAEMKRGDGGESCLTTTSR